MPNIDEAIEALLAYKQADMEGVMVLTSRQAIHEVSDELRRLRAVAARASGHADSEELQALANMIAAMSGRVSLEDDCANLVIAATQLRRFAGWVDAGKALASAERTIDLLEANARIQAKLLADTGRERDSLLHAAQSSQGEMENYRLALAWIKGQATDPQAKEIAATALDSFTHTRPHRHTPTEG